MDQNKLFSLMSTEVIREEEVNKKLEEQRDIMKAGKTFVSQLSINRFMYTNLADFDIEKMLSLFSELTYDDFIIRENELHFSEIDIESFAVILEETFNLEDMYELDNFYIENRLNGRDITKEDIDIYGEVISFADILVKFVFHTSGMSMGDTPNLMLMLTAKKSLLGSYLAERNVESLLSGKREIYSLDNLM